MIEGACPNLCLQLPESGLLLPLYFQTVHRASHWRTPTQNHWGQTGLSKAISDKGGSGPQFPTDNASPWIRHLMSFYLVTFLVVAYFTPSLLFISYLTPLRVCFQKAEALMIQSLLPLFVLHVSGADVARFNCLLLSVRLWAHGVGDRLSSQKNILLVLHMYMLIRSTPLFTDRMKEKNTHKTHKHAFS